MLGLGVFPICIVNLTRLSAIVIGLILGKPPRILHRLDMICGATDDCAHLTLDQGRVLAPELGHIADYIRWPQYRLVIQLENLG